MACDLKTYNPADVTLNVALFNIEGFSENSLIRIEKDENYFNTVKGSAGGVERVHLPDKTYTLTVFLSQTSSSNNLLSSLATLDHLSKLATFPIFAKDSSGQSLFLATTCWIENPSEASYTSSIENREWVIKCTEMTFGIAGNSQDQTAIDKISQLGNLIGQFGSSQGFL